jgi:hypothetical protein
MRFTPFEFFFELEKQGVAIFSECFACPSGYQVLVEIDYSVKFSLDLSLGKSCVLIGLLVAGIGPVVVSVFSIKVPDEDVCEVPWSLIGGFEPVDVVMGDESAVEGEEVIQLLAHAVDISALDHLLEVSNDGYCHGRVLRSIVFGLSFSGLFPCSL